MSSKFKIKKIKIQKKSKPYKMGYDAAINGPNIINCNFLFFNTPENTKEWEQGRKDGLETFKGTYNDQIETKRKELK